MTESKKCPHGFSDVSWCKKCTPPKPKVVIEEESYRDSATGSVADDPFAGLFPSNGSAVKYSSLAPKSTNSTLLHSMIRDHHDDDKPVYFTVNGISGKDRFVLCTSESGVRSRVLVRKAVAMSLMTKMAQQKSEQTASYETILYVFKSKYTNKCPMCGEQFKVGEQIAKCAINIGSRLDTDYVCEACVVTWFLLMYEAARQEQVSAKIGGVSEFDFVPTAQGYDPRQAAAEFGKKFIAKRKVSR